MPRRRSARSAALQAPRRGALAWRFVTFRWWRIGGCCLLIVAGAGWSIGTERAAGAGPSNPAWAVTPQWSHVLADGGSPIAESSPIVATLDGGGPAVVVGDRAGSVYAFHLSDGSPVTGWPVQAAGPVDSTPSVTPPNRFGLNSILVGAGDAAHPVTGGYEGFGPGGNLLWHTSVANPAGDADPVSGVQASLSIGSLQGATDAVAGSLGQEEYAINWADGSTLPGWPFFTSDSDFSTAALADLYGTGGTEIVQGGDQTAGYALGQRYPQGGHLRVLNAEGGQICRYDTNQTVDSSPAVGRLFGGHVGIVVGTGGFFPDASDTDVVEAFGPDCTLQWSARLDGDTFSSPALADVMGDGTLDVVEGTASASGGSVWVVNGANGRKVWSAPVIGPVIGSVTTADLSGLGYQDLLVPTTAGVEILDGRSGVEVAALNAASVDVNTILGFQNSPLVTDDPDGNIGITVAGYDGSNQGVVEHFEVPDSRGATVEEPGSWPMFHHDPQLTGNAGQTPPAPGASACSVPSAALDGYRLVAADGGVFAFGGEPFCGSTGGLSLNARIVAMAVAPASGGYWLVAADGGVFAYGGAGFFGSMGGRPLNKPIVGMAVTADGQGYWLVASDGGIFAFGDARYLGSTGGRTLNKAIVGMSATADGQGYWLVASDGGVFAFGDAHYFGSMGGRRLNRPIVAITEDVATGGYWMVASDGGVFAFDAPFDGSEGGKPLNRPIVGIQADQNGSGYRLVASDGGVFAFGEADFRGSTGGDRLNEPVVGMAGL